MTENITKQLALDNNSLGERAMKFRVLPLTIMCLITLFAVKSFDLIVLEDSYASVSPKAGSVKQLAIAETAAGAEVKVEAKPAEKPVEEKAADATSASSGTGEAKKKEEPKPYSYEKPKEKIPECTESEKLVLEKLASRREELDKMQQELDMKAQLLEVSSKKLDDKLAELKKLQSDTQVLLDSYNEKENAKISSLVKIYEGMKPKEAAAVFEEMDMDILLQIINKMSERKTSPIIAALSPKKAKDVTERIAREKSLGQVASTTPNAGM